MKNDTLMFCIQFDSCSRRSNQPLWIVESKRRANTAMLISFWQGVRNPWDYTTVFLPGKESGGYSITITAFSWRKQKMAHAPAAAKAWLSLFVSILALISLSFPSLFFCLFFFLLSQSGTYEKSTGQRSLRQRLVWRFKSIGLSPWRLDLSSHIVLNIPGKSGRACAYLTRNWSNWRLHLRSAR